MHIAYKGTEFTIEWYYDANRKSQALEYLMNLDASMQQKVFYLFKRMGDFGKISDKTKFRNEGNQIFAFKPKSDRFLSFLQKEKELLLRMLFKKNQINYQEMKKEKLWNFGKTI